MGLLICTIIFYYIKINFYRIQSYIQISIQFDAKSNQFQFFSGADGGGGQEGGGGGGGGRGNYAGGGGGGGAFNPPPHEENPGFEPPDVFCALGSLIVEGRMPGWVRMEGGGPGRGRGYQGRSF